MSLQKYSFYKKPCSYFKISFIIKISVVFLLIKESNVKFETLTISLHIFFLVFLEFL